MPLKWGSLRRVLHLSVPFLRSRGGIAVPFDIPAGSYYLHIVTDADEAIAETVENNNVLRSDEPIQIASSVAGFNIEIDCPEDIILNAPAGATYAVAEWDEAQIQTIENCNGTLSNFLFSQSEGLLNGSCFPIGTSIVQYTLGGDCNELTDTAYCTFDITVIEHPIFYNETQVIVCENEPYQGVFYEMDTLLLDTLLFPNFDSIIAVQLTVLPVFKTHFSATICDGDIFEFAGQMP